MSRDSSGNYTSPSTSFVTGTTISSSVMNGKLDDLGNEITNSLDRNGKGGMLARMRGVDGTTAAPAYSFTSETDIGFYRAGAGDVRFADGAADLLKISAAENRSLVGFKITTGGATIDAGGLTVTAGGATVTAGGLTVTAGGLSVVTGGTSSVGSTPAQGGVAGANTLEASGALSTTSGHSHAISTAAKTTTAGPNVVRLNVRTENSAAVTTWDQVRLGLSYDVDSVVGSGGSFYLSKTGARLAGGTAATATDPANALELTNGNLKLSGTAPNKDEGLSNTLTPANMVKAWANVTADGAGNVILNDGFNIASVSLSAGDLVVTIADDFANTTYTAIAQAFASASVRVYPTNKAVGSTTFGASQTNFGGGTWDDYNLGTSALTIDIHWVGRQA